MPTPAHESRDLLRDSLRRFLAAEASIATCARPLFDDPRGTTPTLWRGLAELGVLGVLLPTDMGGAGLDAAHAGVACEEMGRALFPGPFLASAVAASALLGTLARNDETQRLGFALARGEQVATLASDAPATGYPTPEASVRARRAEKGPITLTGRRSLVAFAETADVLLVPAADESAGGAARPNVFAVERRAAGLGVEPAECLDPARRPATVIFANTPALPLATDMTAAGILAATSRAVDLAAAAAVADGVGAAQRAFELALDWARVRHQFGRPIGSFQAVQHLLVDMLTEISLLRAATDEALTACDRGDAAARAHATAVAAAAAAHSLPEIGATVIQIFGGIGYTWEHDAHLFYRRLLGTSVSAGTEGQNLDRVEALLFDQA